MIIQIYAFTKKNQAIEAAEMGVDHIGMVAGDYGIVPGELTYLQARELASALPETCNSIALTMSTDINQIMTMVDIVRPNIVHISTDQDDFNLDDMEHLKKRLYPDIKLMKAIPVLSEDSISAAMDYANVSDYLLLDSKVDAMPGIGATGETHDWGLSKRIVESVKIPVILAGGLSPENVRASIEVVQPDGVDSNTWTNIINEPVEKDMQLVKRFIEAVRGNFS